MTQTLDLLNGIHHGDCIAGMSALPKGSVELAFADPPFNIGYEYDVYDDRKEYEQYLDWSRDWIAAVHRVLKDDGAFWLAIGDEYAAELKLASQEIGFHCRSWVVWYYTFGVNCTQKFTRSHAHLFYFVKDPKHFTFRADDLDNRIPSARQLVYQDKRANPRGRLPDDTWIIRPADVVGELIDDEGIVSLDQISAPRDDEQTWQIRPQDIESCFTPEEDTWYFPRVAGTFKERKGFHGCQMPEQLLGRIVRTCSGDGDVVLDPFSGSATTLAVAKKLGRKYIGFDLSEDYVQYGRERLSSIRVGDRLDGSPEPLMSAPRSNAPRIKGVRKPKDNTEESRKREREATEKRYQEVQFELTKLGVIEAFARSHEGYSADRVVVDPELNSRFADECSNLGLVGNPRVWNVLLFDLRKNKKLGVATRKRTTLAWGECDSYLFASEIAWQTMLDDSLAESLDEILCDPTLANEFDKRAGRFSPGRSAFEYRWTALKVRKQAKTARSRGAALKPPSTFQKPIPLHSVDLKRLPGSSGVYLLTTPSEQPLYAGESLNLRTRLTCQFRARPMKVWTGFSDELLIQTYMTDASPGDMLAWQSCLVRKYHPRLNVRDLVKPR